MQGSSGLLYFLASARVWVHLVDPTRPPNTVGKSAAAWGALPCPCATTITAHSAIGIHGVLKRIPAGSGPRIRWLTKHPYMHTAGIHWCRRCSHSLPLLWHHRPAGHRPWRYPDCRSRQGTHRFSQRRLRAVSLSWPPRHAARKKLGVDAVQAVESRLTRWVSDYRCRSPGSCR